MTLKRKIEVTGIDKALMIASIVNSLLAVGCAFILDSMGQINTEQLVFLELLGEIQIAHAFIIIIGLISVIVYKVKFPSPKLNLALLGLTFVSMSIYATTLFVPSVFREVVEVSLFLGIAVWSWLIYAIFDVYSRYKKNLKTKNSKA